MPSAKLKLSKAVLKLIKERENEYLSQLHLLVDQIFEVAAENKWSWRRLAQEASLAESTVNRLGDRTTRFPLLRTVLKLAKSVGLQITLTSMKQQLKKKAG